MIEKNLVKNQEALDNPIYNPEVEPEITQLYQLMVPQNEEDDEALLQEYIDMFMELPTTSSFGSVLINPMLCEVEDYRSISQEYTIEINKLRDFVYQVPSEKTTWDNNYQNELGNDFDESVSAVEELLEHTNRIVFNLPTLLGAAQGAAGIATVSFLLSNPCLGLNGFFDSIKEKGKALINGIKNALKNVVNSVKNIVRDIANGIINVVAGFVSSFIDSVKGLMNSLKNAAMAIKDQILSEIKNFAKALLGQLRFGLAGFLKNLLKDPCLKSLLKTVLSGSALGILGAI